METSEKSRQPGGKGRRLMGLFKASPHVLPVHAMPACSKQCKRPHLHGSLKQSTTQLSVSYNNNTLQEVLQQAACMQQVKKQKSQQEGTAELGTPRVPDKTEAAALNSRMLQMVGVPALSWA